MKIYLLERSDYEDCQILKAFENKEQAIKLKNKIRKWILENPRETVYYDSDGKSITFYDDSDPNNLEPPVVKIVKIPEVLQGCVDCWSYHGDYYVREVELVEDENKERN